MSKSEEGVRRSSIDSVTRFIGSSDAKHDINVTNLNIQDIESLDKFLDTCLQNKNISLSVDSLETIIHPQNEQSAAQVLLTHPHILEKFANLDLENRVNMGYMEPSGLRNAYDDIKETANSYNSLKKGKKLLLNDIDTFSRKGDDGFKGFNMLFADKTLTLNQKNLLIEELEQRAKELGKGEPLKQALDEALKANPEFAAQFRKDKITIQKGDIAEEIPNLVKFQPNLNEIKFNDIDLTDKTTFKEMSKAIKTAPALKSLTLENVTFENKDQLLKLVRSNKNIQNLHIGEGVTVGGEKITQKDIADLGEKNKNIKISSSEYETDKPLDNIAKKAEGGYKKTFVDIVKQFFSSSKQSKEKVGSSIIDFEIGGAAQHNTEVGKAITEGQEILDEVNNLLMNDPKFKAFADGVKQYNKGTLKDVKGKPTASASIGKRSSQTGMDGLPT